MEKTYKPVPDCEALRYKGTKDKPDIKIFVSCRIDLNSQTLDNPLYVPIRCGAVYDDSENPTMLGDDTGDNISEKRMSFCELTVQYWAWKNVTADYYGLCHYRRYLAFKTPHFTTTNVYGHLQAEYPFRRTQRAYGLLDVKHMQDVITSCDILAARPADVTKLPTPQGIKNTVKEHWAAHDNEFIKKELLDLLLALIEEMAPKYKDAAIDYYSSRYVWGFNCYVMRKKAFDELCEFQFPILFEMEKRLDTTGYTETMRRTPGFASEILYGIFLHYHQKAQDYSIKTVPLVYFKETNANYSLQTICLNAAKRDIPDFINWTLLPYGSQRRACLKHALQFLHIIKGNDKN